MNRIKDDEEVYTLTDVDMGINEADLALTVSTEAAPISDLKFTTAAQYMQQGWREQVPDQGMDTEPLANIPSTHYPSDDLVQSALDFDLGYIGKDDPALSESADINVDAQIQLINGGIDYLIHNMKGELDLSDNNLGRSAHYVNLTDDQAKWLFHFGCINAYKKGNGL
tara:strand:- start:7785 stop:8288 length:504 start_codon:yes stop_codon:yes gene_type:complete